MPGLTSDRLPSRLNGSSLENHLENDAFSDKSEREIPEESDNETQDHSRKANESGSDQSETPGGPARRGTTYVEQVHEELGEVRAHVAWRRSVAPHLPPTCSCGGDAEAPARSALLGPWGKGNRRPRMARTQGSRQGRVRPWDERGGKATGGFGVRACLVQQRL